MGYNIISKCGNDSLIFQNLFFLHGFLIHSNYTMKQGLMVFNDKFIGLFWGVS